ncbi:hypothetical protein [Planctomyces sp. SH-PL14]|uniref:hypothetical protein n=1 Tax=Planctomyces sp. SH-PL14 TaxID=1632864 RepID=UPI00078EC651|nr:hypothetical protein [Planctomyces sp. SH-PL14]AMV16614.1 hypothetical protein VT03_01910 [Planctomyces sp. SH-PL14]
MLRDAAWGCCTPAPQELLDALSADDRAQVDAFLERENAMLRTTDATGSPQVMWCPRPVAAATASYLRTVRHLTIDEPFIRRGDRVTVCVEVEDGESAWQVFREWFADVSQLGVEDEEGDIPATGVPMGIGGAA